MFLKYNYNKENYIFCQNVKLFFQTCSICMSINSEYVSFELILFDSYFPVVDHEQINTCVMWQSLSHLILSVISDTHLYVHVRLYLMIVY